MQIPDQRLRTGNNHVLIKMGEARLESSLLITSTIQLTDFIENSDNVEYMITAYAKNILAFRNVNKPIQLVDSPGENVEISKQTMGDLSYIEFEGFGNFTLRIAK